MIEQEKSINRLMVFTEQNSNQLSENSNISLGDFLQVLVCLVLIVTAIELFHVEEGLQLPLLMWFVVAGFAVYSYLPVQVRLPFILALNLGALITLFGPVVGLSVLGVGLLLVILASLHVAIITRIILILLVVGSLVVFKMSLIGDGITYQVATIVGGLFMFRIILYLYEIEHEKHQVSLWKRLSYFFLLPNLVFLVFPIVDYKTFVRGFYRRPAVETYRKGIYWIFIGFLHLMIYRIIYSYAVPVPSKVDGIYALLQYLVSSYALIIRLSGIFHLSVGIICLFGFDLPRSFNHYFLASSFADLWHRINIYWRDFVMRIFYFPIYLRFKNRNKRAVFITVLLVFGINFLMHAYQWFWIRGKFSVTQTDVIFWGGLGLLLAFNSVWLMKAKRDVRASKFSIFDSTVHAAKVLAMFIFMCVMWSIWTSPSLAEWQRLMLRGSDAGMQEAVILLSGGLVLIAAGVLAQYVKATWMKGKPLQWKSPGTSLYLIGGMTASLCAIASTQLSEKIEAHWQVDMSPVLKERLNTQDADLLHTGYYEELIIGNNITSRVWELQEAEKAAEKVTEPLAKPALDNRFSNTLGKPRGKKPKIAVKRKVDNILLEELKPNIQVIFQGAQFTTNKHGMRDRPYTVEKPKNTYRIAQVGSSPQLGYGVADHQTAEKLVEDWLNASDGWGDYDRVEILNFSVGGYGLMQRAVVVEELIGRFEPDLVLLYLHTAREERRNRKKVVQAMKRNLVGDYPLLAELQQKLQIDVAMSRREAEELLVPYDEFLYQWSLDRITRHCKENNLKLLIVVHGTLGVRERYVKKSTKNPVRRLKERGLLYIDVSDVWDNEPYEEMINSEWDRHPNAKAHALVAEGLLRGLREYETILTDGATAADK